MASNPYLNNNFLDFLLTFVIRMGKLVSGDLKFSELALDEMQILVLILIGASCAFLGIFLILKRSTMLANSLSHSVLLGIVLAEIILKFLVFRANPLLALYLAALLSAFLTTTLTHFLTHTLKFSEDVSIGVVFSALFALGVVLATIFTQNSQLSVEAVMGDLEGLKISDFKNLWLILGLNLVLIVPFFNYFKVTTFDTVFSQMLGLPLNLLYYLLMFMVAVTVMAAFKVVGVVLVLALIVMPVMIARIFSKSILQMAFWSLIITVVSSIVSIALSRHVLSVYGITISTSGVVSTLMGLAFLVLGSFKRSCRT